MDRRNQQAVTREQEASLCFLDHPLDRETIARLVGEEGPAPERCRFQGDIVRPGATHVIRKSFVSYCLYLPRNCPMDEMIPRLWDFMGGFDHVVFLLNQIKPKDLELNLTLPFKYSKDDGNGCIQRESIAQVGSLGASLTFSFL